MRWVWGVASGALALLVWQLVVWLTGVGPFILPGPQRVMEALWENADIIAENGLVTLTGVLTGLVLGSALGIATAIHLSLSPTTRRLLLPVLVFMQAVPIFALAPIMTLWFGFGLAPKIIVAVLIIYFPVTSAFLDGLDRTPKGYLDLAEVMGASEWRSLWHLRVPAALPSLGSGLRLAAVYAPIGVVISEWVGSAKGLGFLMLLANGRAKTDLMFAALFALALGTVVLYRLISALALQLERYGTGDER